MKPNHKKMLKSGRLVRDTFHYLTPFVKVGITTSALDLLAYEYMIRHGGIPAPLGYSIGGLPPFPKSICTSSNAVAAHGIPRESEELVEGDIISIDISLSIDGHFADACKTYMVGEVSEEASFLVRATKTIHELLIEYASDNHRNLMTGDIGAYTEVLCDKFGLYPIPGCGGHGIGTSLHLPPFVPPNSDGGEGVRIKQGSYFTIEPLIAIKQTDLVTAPDRWTMVSPQGVLIAQEEHTLYLGVDGLEILT